jgi:hypothetical protein
LEEQIMHRLITLSLPVLFVLILPGPAQAAERVLGEKNGLVAVTGDGFSCQNPAVTVRANDASVFEGRATNLQRFIGLLRAALGFECPTLNEISITGEVRGDAVYAGRVLAANRWRLESLPLSGEAVHQQAVSSKSTPESTGDTRLPQNGRDGINGPWRFKLICGSGRGQLPIHGFFDLKVHGSAAEALFEGFVRYPQIGFLKTSGSFDKESGSLTLKSSGFVPGQQKLGPFDITASIQDGGRYMTGSAQGVAPCPTLTAWKTAFDMRRNPEGMVMSVFKDAKKSTDIRQETAFKKLTDEQCEKFGEWYAKSIVLKTPDGSVASAFVDSEAMLDVLGFTYDGMTKIDSKGYSNAGGACFYALRNSAKTEHAALSQKIKKSDSSTGANYSPNIIAHHGGKIGNTGRPNYYWYQNMYIATAIRDARILLQELRGKMRSLPSGPDGLAKIEAEIIRARSSDGLMAYLPEQDRKLYIESLNQKKEKITEGAVNASLEDINWDAYDATIEGLVAMKKKEVEIKKAFENNPPALAKIVVAFSVKQMPLSKKLGEKAIDEFPGFDMSLKGLRDSKNLKNEYYNKYLPALNNGDTQRLQQHLDKTYGAYTAEVSKYLGGWLDKEIPKSREGIKMLDSISIDVTGSSLEVIENDKDHSSSSLAAIIVDNYHAIKQAECIVPKGFEEMKEVICPGS